MTAPTIEINPEVIEQKIGIVFGAHGRLVTSSMIHVGHEQGLYHNVPDCGHATEQAGKQSGGWFLMCARRADAGQHQLDANGVSVKWQSNALFLADAIALMADGRPDRLSRH